MKYNIQYIGDKGYLRVSVKQFVEDLNYKIDVDADYQRENVWSTQQKVDLLDSIIKQIDIPKMYLAEVSNHGQFDYECVDGKQRMLTLMSYFKPDFMSKEQLKVNLNGRLYSYKELIKDHPKFATAMGHYPLDFVLYNKDFLEKHDSHFIDLIFRRLQLGKPLNSGEILHAHPGLVKEFVYKKIGKNGLFVRNTGLSEKRFSREFVLAQICFNSVMRNKKGKFERARLTDLEDFFDNPADDFDDQSKRIMQVLNEMDIAFKNGGRYITSRAAAVSAYLFVEKLLLGNKKGLIAKFAKFYLALLEEIQQNSKTIGKYDTPSNRLIMERFHRYISQASVEEYSIRKREAFLKEAFDYYLRTGKIISDARRV